MNEIPIPHHRFGRSNALTEGIRVYPHHVKQYYTFTQDVTGILINSVTGSD